MVQRLLRQVDGASIVSGQQCRLGSSGSQKAGVMRQQAVWARRFGGREREFDFRIATPGSNARDSQESVKSVEIAPRAHLNR